jgi:hypothetical protein
VIDRAPTDTDEANCTSAGIRAIASHAGTSTGMSSEATHRCG